MNSTTSALVTSAPSGLFATSQLFHSSVGNASSVAEKLVSTPYRMDTGRFTSGFSFQAQSVSTTSSADSGGVRVLFGKPIMSTEDQPRMTEVATEQQTVDTKTSLPTWEQEQESKSFLCISSFVLVKGERLNKNQGIQFWLT